MFESARRLSAAAPLPLDDGPAIALLRDSLQAAGYTEKCHLGSARKQAGMTPVSSGVR